MARWAAGLRGRATLVAVATAIVLPTTITYSAGSPVAVRLQVTGTNPITLRLEV